VSFFQVYIIFQAAVSNLRIRHFTNKKTGITVPTMATCTVMATQLKIITPTLNTSMKNKKEQ
jgi:hypothetical protein